MQVAVEISYYPLQADYSETILDFIKSLKQEKGIQVATNQLSTQISGNYDLVMQQLQKAMKLSLEEGPTASFVLKILNVAITPGQAVEVV